MQGISKILYTSSVFANHYDQTLTPFPLHFPVPRLYQCKASVRQDFQLTSCSRNHLQFIFFTWALLPVPLFTHFHLKIQIQGSELTRVTKYVGEVAADHAQPWERRVPSPLHAAGEQPGAKPLPTSQAAASHIWHNHFTVMKEIPHILLPKPLHLCKWWAVSGGWAINAQLESSNTTTGPGLTLISIPNDLS